MIGVIFSMYPLFSFIFGFIMGKNLNKWNKKWMLEGGIFFLGCSTLLFGLSCIIPYMSLFIIFSILGRCSQGMSIATYLTSAYAYIPEYWSDEIDQRMGWMEIASTVGIGLGPLIGSIIFELGYIWIYIVPCLLIMVFGNIIFYFVFPSKNFVEAKKRVEIESEMNQTISIRESFCNKEMLYVFFTLVMTTTSCTIILPGFELKVLQMGSTSLISTVIYLIGQLGETLGCVLLLFFKVENRRGVFFFSVFFNIIGLSY